MTFTEEPIYKLTFGLPEGVLLGIDLSVGEFLRVRHPQGGKPRSYSPVSVDVPGEFQLCVKCYTNGFVSAHLCNMEVGQTARISGPFPPFWVPFVRAGAAPRVGLIAFGVGITEVLPLAKLELAAGDSEVRLLWANRSPQDTYEVDELKQLERNSNGRFRVVFLFSRVQGEVGTLQGRLTQPILQEVFGDWQAGADARFVVVGTKQMKRFGYAMLRDSGFPLPLIMRRPLGCFCRKNPFQHT